MDHNDKMNENKNQNELKAAVEQSTGQPIEQPKRRPGRPRKQTRADMYREFDFPNYHWNPDDKPYGPEIQRILIADLGYEIHKCFITKQSIRMVNGKPIPFTENDKTALLDKLVSIEDRVSFSEHRMYLNHNIAFFETKDYQINPVYETLKDTDIEVWNGDEYTNKFIDIIGPQDALARRTLFRFLNQCVLGWCFNAKGQNQLRYCPVFYGETGIGKSKIFQVMTHYWSGDDLLPYTSQLALDDCHNRRKLKAALNSMVCEIPEMDQFSSKDDMAFLKQLLTRPTDNEVGLFKDDNMLLRPRLTSFSATTNKWRVLNDRSGSDRFPPIHCVGDKEGGPLSWNALTNFGDERMIYVYRERFAAIKRDIEQYRAITDKKEREKYTPIWVVSGIDKPLLITANAEHQVIFQTDADVEGLFDTVTNYRCKKGTNGYFTANQIRSWFVQGAAWYNGQPKSPTLNSLRPDKIGLKQFEEGLDKMAQRGIIRVKKGNTKRYTCPPPSPEIRQEMFTWFDDAAKTNYSDKTIGGEWFDILFPDELRGVADEYNDDPDKDDSPFDGLSDASYNTENQQDDNDGYDINNPFTWP